jgi:hypothetical protein
MNPLVMAFADIHRQEEHFFLSKLFGIVAARSKPVCALSGKNLVVGESPYPY